MKAVLIDDEVHCIGALEILLQRHCPEIEIVGKANNGEEGILVINQHKPEVVFLDIEMPRINGFEMLSHLKDIDFKIIFTTAYDTFAIKAFRVSAVDYLLKPVDKNELMSAVEKAKAYNSNGDSIDKSTYQNQIDSLLENIKVKTQQFPNLALPTLSGLEMVKINDILYLESDGNYTRLFKENKEDILVSKTLKVLEEQLRNHNFVRIHHSHMVNINRITRYVQGDGGYVILENGQHLNVSRRKKNALMEKLTL